MKRIKLISLIIVLANMMYVSSVSAQSGKTNKGNTASFIKKSFTASFGFGIGRDYSGNFRNGSGLQPDALEYGLFNAGPGVVSVGAETGISFSNESSDRKKTDFKTRTIVVAARSAWHHNWDVSRLDTYAGVSAGIGFQHEEYNDGIKRNYDKLVPAFGGFAGASYYITSIAANVELGFDITVIQAGLIFKLR